MPKAKINISSPTAAARSVIEKIRAVQESIPDFQPATANSGRHLVPTATLPNTFIEAACAAVDASPELRSAVKVNPDEARESLAFSMAFEPAAEEAEALARGIRHTIAVRRARAGDAALHTYDVAKSLARRGDGANLTPHVTAMKHGLGRGGKRVKAAKATPPAQQ